MRFQNPTILFCFLLFSITKCYAQSDTLFWFAAPKVIKHAPDEAKTLLFRIAASDQDAVVHFSQPANPAFPDTTIFVPASQSSTLNVTPWVEMIENLPHDSIANQGIRIRATAKVSVYYEATDIDDLALNPEIYVLKGQAALGKLFYLPFQDYWSTHSIPQAFTLVATEDNTTVVITPTNDLLNHPANVPFWIELQKGQTYSVKAQASLNYFLSGTKVASNKPVAITIVDDGVSDIGVSTCADQAGDQITPATILGTEYLVVKGFLGSQLERVFITASENNTEVMVNNSLVATLQAGELYRHTSSLSEPSLYISTSEPVYLYHVTGIGCEVGGAQLPGLDCRGSRHVQFTRANRERLFLFLLGEGEVRNSFSVNGVPVNGLDLNLLDGPVGEWYGGWVEIDTNWVSPGQNCTVTNNAGVFQLGMLHGGGASGCRYGYFSDYRELDANLPDRIDTCEVNAINISAPDFEETAYLWNTGDLTTATVADTSGWYWVELNRDNCIDRDSVWVQFDEVAVFETNTLCPGTSFDWRGLTIEAGGQYETNVSGLNADCDTIFYLDVFQFPILKRDTLYKNICQGQEASFGGNTIGETGVYVRTSNVPDSCGYQQLLILEVDPPYLLQEDDTLCPGDTLQFGQEYYTEAGIYQDTLRDEDGCLFINELTLSSPPQPELQARIYPAIGTALGAILVDTILGSNYAFRWSNGAQTSGVNQLQAGTYYLSITDEFACQYIFDFELEEENGFYLPNAFSPNGDGINDVFRFYTALQEYTLLTFQVFDRWGGSVFASTAPRPQWDGMVKGKLGAAGVYTYLVRIELGLERRMLLKGDVMLVR
ncbi:MAG: hypothetical protein DHS20C18_36650 [Saprospiraceae bacterium]|nr:MAG: hypothetical protein DHS20C18_36650 [Saprospiraceae bacterium]